MLHDVYDSTRDRLIQHLKPLYYHDYHNYKWYTKTNNVYISIVDLIDEICLSDNTTWKYENVFNIILHDDNLKFELTPNDLFETKFLFPELLDAILDGDPLHHCLEILRGNPSTAFATDKYGNDSLYHILEKSLSNPAMSFKEYLTLFNRLLDIVGALDCPNRYVEERVLYLASSRNCVKKYPSFLKTLIRRGANVNFVFGENPHYEESIMYHLADDYKSIYQVKVPQKTLIYLFDLLHCHGADINWRNDNDFCILHFFTCRKNSDYDIWQYLLSKGLDFSDSLLEECRSCHLPKKHELVNRWPTTMGIIVLKEIGLYHHLDCDTFMDLYEFTFDAFVQ
jgi:hypothetical protein